MGKQIIGIIQARMGSTRLPGKVLMDVGGKLLIEQMLFRLSKSILVNEWIVAITNNPEDDSLNNWLIAHGYKVYRGSDWDVLTRFYEASLSLRAEKGDTLIRICADNPLHSAKVVDFVVEHYFEGNYEYFSNSNHEPDFLEDGFDTEVFSFEALQTAYTHATLLSEREHVTPYIKNCGKFKCGWKKSDSNYHYKLSVDTLEDLQSIRNIISSLNDKEDFTIHDVINLIKQNPDIIAPNKHSVINAGYKKSLDNDKRVL